MRRCKALPRLWLFTDPRLGPDLADALERLPKGKAGVIFRDYDAPDRLARAQVLRRATRARRLLLIIAGDRKLAQRVQADGVHLPAFQQRKAPRAHKGLRTASAHNQRELVAAHKAGADLVFLSPLYPTQSHPNAPALGRVRFARLAHQSRTPIAALGGITTSRAKSLKSLGAEAWGAIEAWRQRR